MCLCVKRIKKIQDIKHSAELRKKSTEQEKATSVKLFNVLMRSIERCQAELLKMMEEKQKAAEKQDEELIQELQQEISELKLRNTELDHLLDTEDHLHLLQVSVSLSAHITTQDNTHTHAKGFLLSPTVDLALPVQPSTHQELA
ncbi:uncharacterized protein btr04 isoform X1 [Megalobrama amblycephala]|uniref:uncharacterized protein btr04 isoform X1 n=1 Tax=Megalobrama amblycephala TaxID=75352 RepID=UPI00201438E2|nr:uncharacterized protein btr04 isoform X1 [Megalobrama amblycephala]